MKSIAFSCIRVAAPLLVLCFFDLHKGTVGQETNRTVPTFEFLNGKQEHGCVGGPCSTKTVLRGESNGFRSLHKKASKGKKGGKKTKKAKGKKTKSPSVAPSQAPSVSTKPSAEPSLAPSVSINPSLQPSTSIKPSLEPSLSPSASASPSVQPSKSPSASPSVAPSNHPSVSASPSVQPSKSPSAFPSVAPSNHPSVSVMPSRHPSVSVMPSIISCPCNTEDSFFRQFVTGTVLLDLASGSFCANSDSTALAVFSVGAIAAGGEASGSGSGNWACESAGGQSGDVGFLPNLSEEEARYCGDLVRNAIIANGFHPSTDCQTW